MEEQGENQNGAVQIQETAVPPGLNRKLLDLAAERTAEIVLAGRKAMHFFRPLKSADWLKYVQELRSEEILETDKVTSVSQASEAGAGLWEASCIRVEGYSGVGEDWKKKIPLGHKLAAVLLLQQVVALDAGNPFELSGDTRSVRLEAGWNGEVFDQLVHRFRVPSQAEGLEYSRISVQFFRSTGHKDGARRIHIPPRLKQLCELYDRLVVEVSGYQMGGVAGAIHADVDALHKQAAVTALFDPPMAEVASGE